MTLKQISRYQKLLRRLEHAEELLVSLTESSTEPGTAPLEKITSGHVGDKVGNLAIEIEDLKERKKYLKSEIEKEKRKIFNFLDTIEDERARMALRLKYYRDFTWFNIATMFGIAYNEDGVKKLCYRHLEETDIEDLDKSF